MINKLIGRLKEQQVIVAKAALEQPPSPDVNVQYMYGQRIGYYAGLQKALDLIDSMLKDQDKHDDLL